MLIAGLLVAVGCSGDQAPGPRPLPPPDPFPAFQRPEPPPDPVASYRIEASLDSTRHRLRASQVLTWVNTGETPVTELPFHLYLNAFKNERSVFLREPPGRHRRPPVTRGMWGWIEVDSIRVDGGPDLVDRAHFPDLEGDETVMIVPLDTPLGPGQTTRVAMTFELQLPALFARTGYQEEFTMVAQWFPKVGVRIGAPGDERWHCEPFHRSSEFFADFGTYDVFLTVPDTLVVAATGVLVAATENPDRTRTLHFHADAVHDFAWAADPHFEQLRDTARTAYGDVEVRVYYRPDQRSFAHRHLAAGVAAIETLSARLAPYPWSLISIIAPPPEAAHGAGGMEYPTLVTTGSEGAHAPVGVHLPEFTTIHEVGHNWFQGMLASNEVDEAWLDEGVNEYVDGLVLAELYGDAASAVGWAGLSANYYELEAALAWPFSEAPDPPATHSYEFADYGSYFKASYSRTAAALRTLENVVGSERFLAALERYVARYSFAHPTGADLVSALEESLGQDLRWYLDPALLRAGAADLRVRAFECARRGEPRGVFGRGPDREERYSEPDERAPYHCSVVIENRGSVPVPVDVEIVFADGPQMRRRWDDRGDGPRWHRFELDHREPILEVTIDPDRKVLLDDGGLHRSIRARSDHWPAARAASSAQFITQTAMQLFGP